MNCLRVSGFTPGFGNNHDFSVFVNQNKIHRVLFFPLDILLMCAQHFEGSDWDVWYQALRHIAGQFSSPDFGSTIAKDTSHIKLVIWSYLNNNQRGAIKRSKKQILKLRDIDDIVHYITFTYIYLRNFQKSSISKLSSILRFQVFNLSSFSVIFIIIHHHSSISSTFGHGRRWKVASQVQWTEGVQRTQLERRNGVKRSPWSFVKSLESLNLLKYFGWCLLMSWEHLRTMWLYVQKGKNDVLKERCVFLFPGFFGPEIWQFNSEHMALYADERWTWLSHQQIVDFDWTVNSF